MTQKKVLIMSASIGSGHTQAARAVAEYIRSLPEACDVEELDFLSNDSLSIDNLVKETYIKILDVFPMLYDLMYSSSQEHKKGQAVKTMIAYSLRRRMQHILAEKKPDIIICTHPFPAGPATLLKRQHKLSIPIVGVITDFAVHQLWVYPQLDLYCVAATQLKDQLMKQGIPEDRILVSGIPVRQAFQGRHWQGNRRANNILIMGGGLGLGSMKHTLTELDTLDCIQQFTVVTGHNADLFDEINTLKKSLTHHVELLGYTNQIPELMEQASLLVTKPGALTCTEAATVQVPLLLSNALPGQEEENAAYLRDKGCAVWVKDDSKIAKVTKELLTHPQKLEDMSRASLSCHRNGARSIGTQVLRLLYPGERDTVPTAPPLYVPEA